MQYQVLANIVLKILLPFPTTCESELGFPSMHQIKTKHRSRFEMEQPSVFFHFSYSDDQETGRNKICPTFPFSKASQASFPFPTLLHL
jgi:hypothetical protein